MAQSPASYTLSWLPFGLGLLALLVSWLVTALLGAWQMALALCIECPRGNPFLAPGLTLLGGSLFAGVGAGISLWLTGRAKRRGARVSDSLTLAGVLLLLLTGVTCLLGTGLTAHALR